MNKQRMYHVPQPILDRMYAELRSQTVQRLIRETVELQQKLESLKGKIQAEFYVYGSELESR